MNRGAASVLVERGAIAIRRSFFFVINNRLHIYITVYIISVYTYEI